APLFFKQMMAVMKTQGGDRATARQIYSQMFNEAPDQSTKDTANLRLQELDSFDERDAIDTALEKVKTASGSCPQRLADVFPSLRNLPNGKDFRINGGGDLVDPSNAPYLLDRATCTVVLSPNSKMPKR